jgi:uncharacterized membrane protein YqhA
MDALQLKNKIIKRIIEIEDVELLKSIDVLFNTSDKNISKFLAFANEKSSQSDETEHYTDYIKEWVKSM